MRDLYFSRIGLPILLQENLWTNPGNLYIANRHMNVEIGTKAAQFPEKEYINGVFVAVFTNDSWIPWTGTLGIKTRIYIKPLKTMIG